MQQGTLTHAWTLTEAAMPQGWALMGLVRGPAGADDMDPVVSLEDGWYAWAVRTAAAIGSVQATAARG